MHKLIYDNKFRHSVPLLEDKQKACTQLPINVVKIESLESPKRIFLNELEVLKCRDTVITLTI